MEQKFVETIKIQGGEIQGLPYHQARMERTIRRFFPHLAAEAMPSLVSILKPEEWMWMYFPEPEEKMDFSNGEERTSLLKARVVYGAQGVEKKEYAPYTMREIRSLRVVEDDDIDYTYKSCNRTRLNALVAQKGDCDDVIIVRRGLVTDTSFTNLALFDGQRWVTPLHPLLAGTKRARLLSEGILTEAEVTVEDLRKAQKVSLLNAMIELGEREVGVSKIQFT